MDGSYPDTWINAFAKVNIINNSLDYLKRIFLIDWITVESIFIIILF